MDTSSGSSTPKVEAVPDIIVRKLDEAYIIVDCAEPSVQQELNTYFTFYAPKYQHHPLYRRKKWDGKIRLYSTATRKLYAGLLRYVLAFSQERNYKVEVQDGVEVLNNFSLEQARFFMMNCQIHVDGKPVDPHEHQILGVAKAIRYKRLLLKSATNSGKSLMAYCLFRYLLQKMGGGCKRGILIVPNVHLVNQMYNDFKDYADGKWYPVATRCQKYFAGLPKEIDSTTGLLITTWQSIYDNDAEWFKQFDFVIGDEAHGFKADCLKYIMTSLVNARYRIGMTGTLDDWKVHRLVIEGHFGPTTEIARNKELQDKGISSLVKLKSLILKHPEADCKEQRRRANQRIKDEEHRVIWKDEMDYLTHSDKRNRFVMNLTNSVKNNVLILVQYREHAQRLYNMIQGQGKVAYLVTGELEADEREKLRKVAEENDNIVIIATYGVFSTGVNVKNLHHLILASPIRGQIRLLQSIGRMLRVKEGKDYVTVYDISDDLRCGKWINTTLKHYTERLEIYKKEEWKVSAYVIQL